MTLFPSQKKKHTYQDNTTNIMFNVRLVPTTAGTVGFFLLQPQHPAKAVTRIWAKTSNSTAVIANPRAGLLG
jgi:hypothetical protein